MANLDYSVAIQIALQGEQGVDRLRRAFVAMGADADSAERQARELSSELGGNQPRAAQQATTALDRTAKSARGVGQESERAGALLQSMGGRLQTVLAAAGLGVTVRELSQVADQYANILARLRLVEGGAEGAVARFDQLRQVADATGSSLDATATLYTRVVQSGAAAGQQAVDVVRTINQAIQVSGASSQESEAAVRQLIQGLQSGVLRGEEFNSVMEQSPRLARAMADGLGVPLGALRQMAADGKLTTEAVVQALQSQSAAIEQEFGQLPDTIGRAAQRVANAWTAAIGALDQTGGYSRTAAEALSLLARNMDTLIPLVVTAGKAFAAYKAIGFALELASIANATRTAAAAQSVATQAVAANTAATIANTAAKNANAAAGARAASAASGIGAAAGSALPTVSALGGALGTLGRFAGIGGAIAAGLYGLLSVLKDVGTWIGVTIAKLQGYRDAEEVLAEAQAREKDAQEASNKARQQAATAAADAERKTLALSVASQTLVATFDEEIKKGKSVAETLDGIGKALDLSNITGIQTAIGALDALEQKGKITGDQLRATLQGALKDVDLQGFEIQARAAFDNSSAGARRLADALDAQLAEALRRTGKDAGELSAGVNRAAQSAINDLDVLIANLDRLRQQGVDVGIALGASLEGALKKATTIAAVEEIIARWKALGEQGVITGQQLTDGLESARAKLDELTPGVNSLAEAYKTLGVTSQAELARAADSAREAFNVLRQGQAPLADLQAAFGKYADAQIRAHGEGAKTALEAQAAVLGIEPAWLKAAGAADEAGAASARAGETIAAAASQAADGWDAAADAIGHYSAEAGRAASAARGAPGGAAGAPGQRGQRERTGITSQDGYDAAGYALNTDGQRVGAQVRSEAQAASQRAGIISGELGAYGVDANSADAQTYASLRQQITDIEARLDSGNRGVNRGLQSGTPDAGLAAEMLRLRNEIGTVRDRLIASGSSTSVASSSQSGASTSRTVTLRLQTGGQTSSINLADEASADALIEALRRAGLVAS